MFLHSFLQAKVKAGEILRQEDTRLMFPYIDSILQLHVDMLKSFQLRMKTWWVGSSYYFVVT